MVDIPGELVRMVLAEAARVAVDQDRSWATELALISRDVYKFIRPIIYHRMVITEVNSATIRRLADDDAFTHVFAAIRHIVYAVEITKDTYPDIRPSVFKLDASRIIILDGPDFVLRDLGRQPGFAPQDLALSSPTPGVIVELPPSALSSITHIRIFIAGLKTDDTPWSHVGVDDLVDRLPALTHLALDIIRPFFSSDYRHVLSDVLQSVLHRERIERVVCHVVLQVFGPTWPALHQACRALRDPRIYMSIDDSPDARPHHLNDWKLRAERATAGRSIWDEGEPTCTLESEDLLAREHIDSSSQ
ncbi:hypothetical protein EXIGLDRAFT_721793 [Exidia glandulosa HHB12029]|uniref:F-box domain-containing protein n=1 Tax=Exidia glandulosa HHB12029 TaxID=1314781 RepID=A0A165QGW6_EXIGL|nr:hypothetical protein EXIGLDRAFT_721793 [Exidia glandulosa HHB12029]